MSGLKKGTFNLSLQISNAFLLRIASELLLTLPLFVGDKQTRWLIVFVRLLDFI